jgi:hypothetical protein
MLCVLCRRGSPEGLVWWVGAFKPKRTQRIHFIVQRHPLSALLWTLVSPLQTNDKSGASRRERKVKPQQCSSVEPRKPSPFVHLFWCVQKSYDCLQILIGMCVCT